MGDEFAPKILEIVNEMRDELHHLQQQQRVLRGEEAKAGALVDRHLQKAGCDTYLMQSDNLCGDSNHPERAAEPSVCSTANKWGADVFVSIHCNSAGRTDARGTEVEVYARGGNAERLANCILRQIVDSVGTVERGVNEKPGYAVLKHTAMPAVLVEMAFINNAEDVALWRVAAAAR